MQEIFKLLVGIVFLFLGIPIGNLLAKLTKEEIGKRQKWFKFLIISCVIIGTLGFFFGNDILMFSFFFIAVVTSRSLKNRQI